MKAAIAIVAGLVLATVLFAAAHAQMFCMCQVGNQFAPNHSSPLAINLAEVSPATNEQPFLNVAKTGGGWYTINGASDTGEEAYLYTNCLDSNGYPTTLSTTVGSCTSGGHTFNAVSFAVMTLATNYGGTWMLDYDGSGTIVVSKDGSGYTSCPITGHPNRHIFTSGASGAGIGVEITATTVGNTLQNIRMTYAPTSTCGNGTTATQDSRETKLYGGEEFNPDFIAKIQNFKVLRFMDWLETNRNSNLAITWSTRSPYGWVFWDESTINGAAQSSGTLYLGVPWEIIADLANEVDADPWVNIGAQADDTYATNAATLIHGRLTKGQHVYVEYANEVWNGTFHSHFYVQTQAIATFGAGCDDGCKNWQGMRQAQIGADWKTAWGADSARITSVIGVQTLVSTGSGTDSDQILKTPMWTGTGVLLAFTGAIDNGSGGAGTILHITAIASGSPAVGSPVYGINGDTTLYTKITACPGGICGGTGDYTVNFSQHNASETMHGGGGPAPGGPAQPSFDAIAIAPYFGYDPPSSWISSADGGKTQVFTELMTGGLMPTGSATCTAGGTSTALTVSSNTGNCSSNGSVSCLPADQTIVPVFFPTAPGASPTIAVDGCTTSIPFQQGCVASQGGCSAAGLEDPSAVGNNTTWNITYVAGQGANGTWVLAFLGYSGGGLAQVKFYENQWVTYGAALSPALPIVWYEGGQGYNGNNSLIFNLNDAIQTDSRMTTAYAQYLSDWKSVGGELASQFNDIQGWGTFGYWGAYNTDVTSSATAKSTGLQNFIASHPCWWTGPSCP